jgi:cephalosporin-C deacetylase
MPGEYDSVETKPVAFEPYWQQTIDALVGCAACPELDVIPLRSTDFATVYSVRLTSLGPYRVFGYLSIPAGEGPFPAIYYAPKYQSVLEIIPQGTATLQRSRYMTFSLAARGQRNADSPYAAMFPGLLTERIESAEAYIFRKIVADSVRGLDFLLSRPELDPSRVLVYGNDLALMTAALHAGATHVVTAPTLFYHTIELASQTQAYPLEEINDYLRTFPERRAAVEKTLAYYDLRAFAPRLRATALVMAGPTGSSLGAQALEPLMRALPGRVQVYESAQSTYKDGLYAETWMAEQCGITEVSRILPEHWR